MKSHTKESGSVVHIVIITILVVAVMGLLGFVFWQNFLNKPSNNSIETAPTSATEQTTPSIAITEWDLKADYDKEALGTVSYMVSGNTLTFSSSVLENTILPCTGISADSWGIKKAQAGDTDQFGTDVADSWTKIGDAYYSRFYPQSGCEEKTSQVGSIDAAYNKLFKNLEQAQ